eukprot:403355597
MELLNNFFSTSGKNNFYNQLPSQKASPLYSPRSTSKNDNNDLTFAHQNQNSLQYLQQQEQLIDSDKSWDLEEDEINEFNDVDENMPVPTNKPTLQYIEPQRSHRSIKHQQPGTKQKQLSVQRVKSNTRDDKQSSLNLSRQSRQSGVNQLNKAISQSPLRHNFSRSPIFRDQLPQVKERNYLVKTSLGNHYQNDYSKNPRLYQLNQSLSNPGKISTSLNLSVNRQQQQKREVSNSSKSRQIGVIKQSMRKMVEMSEQAELNSIMNQKRYMNQNVIREREQYSTSPTNKLQQKIQSKLSSQERQVKQSQVYQQKVFKEKQFGYDNLKKLSMDHFSIEESNQTRLQNKRYEKKQNFDPDLDIGEDSQSIYNRNNSSNGSQKRGRQSNQRNNFRSSNISSNSGQRVSTQGKGGAGSTSSLSSNNNYAYQNHASDYTGYQTVQQDLKQGSSNAIQKRIRLSVGGSSQQNIAQSNLNQTSNFGSSSIVNTIKAKPIGGSQLFNATPNVQQNYVNLGSTKNSRVQKNFQFFQSSVTNQSPLRRESNERNSSRHSSQSRLSNVSRSNRGSESKLKRPVVHEEYLQSNRVTSSRAKDRTIFK